MLDKFGCNDSTYIIGPNIKLIEIKGLIMRIVKVECKIIFDLFSIEDAINEITKDNLHRYSIYFCAMFLIERI